MKILFSGYHNPFFSTVTEYAEQAFEELGHRVCRFDDQAYLLPGRLRGRVPMLESWDLGRMNRDLLSLAYRDKPDLCFVSGGYRMLPDTILAMKKAGIVTVLWTIDVPRSLSVFRGTEKLYDFVFCGGSETKLLFEGSGRADCRLLPFACSPALHARQDLSEADLGIYSCEIAFVGTVDPRIYPERARLLESLSGFDLGVWGPGGDALPPSSPVRRSIRGGETPPETWSRIYSAAKMTVCRHFYDATGKVLCHQASPRVFEALSCGILLLVDAQKDVLALFENGKHLVVFNDAEDLKRKAAYYLENAGERERIAREGHREVLARHTYVHRMREVLDIAGRGAGPNKP